MDSANLHHQDQLHVQYSSPLATPSFYGAGSTHAWTPNTILSSTSNFSPNINGAILVNSRDTKQQNDILVTPLNNSMIQDQGFHWATTAGIGFNGIKEEFSDSYPNFTEMTNSPSSIQDLHLHPPKNNIDLNEKLLLTTFTSGCQISKPAGEFYFNPQNCSTSGSARTGINITPSRGTFSQIFPTVNISKLNQSSTEISSSLGMNLEGLDLFNSSRFNGSFSQPSQDHLGIFKESLDHVQQLGHRPSNSPSKTSSFTARVTETKRSSSFLEPIKAPQTAPKKSRLDSRASCPSFKVGKEKLGDRIAALQQLVAPFGKTDRASVLMEAIGYIKFLQHQVQTLSVPYMKSSRNKTSRPKQGPTTDGDEESNQDLRSRGLCLVPMSCLSYVTDGGGGVWPPSNFNGGI